MISIATISLYQISTNTVVSFDVNKRITLAQDSLSDKLSLKIDDMILLLAFHSTTLMFILYFSKKVSSCLTTTRF